MWKDIDENIVPECPYRGISVRDKIVKIDSIPSIFAQGHYRTDVNLTTKNNEKIIDIDILYFLNSSERNSFG